MPLDRRVTRAGKKLGDLLHRRGIRISDFARNAGVNRVSVHRLISGERWRAISVDFALAVIDATNGAIEIEDFASLTAVATSDSEEPNRSSTGTDG